MLSARRDDNALSRLGLRSRDRLVALNGRTVTSVEGVEEFLILAALGAPLLATVERRGEHVDLERLWVDVPNAWLSQGWPCLTER